MTQAQSTGIIISPTTYEEAADALKEQEEYVPAVQDISSIRYSLANSGTLGPAYDQLTPIQKKWLETWWDPGDDIEYHCDHNRKTIQRTPSKPCMRIKN